MRRMITGLSIQGCRIYFFGGSAPNPVKGLSPLKPAIFLLVSVFCQISWPTKDSMGPLPHFDKTLRFKRVYCDVSDIKAMSKCSSPGRTPNDDYTILI